MPILKDRAILLLALGQTLAWAGVFYIFPASLVRWEAALGWTKAELTGAFTLAVLASALAAPVAGWLIDMGKGPAMMGLSTALAGICVAAISLVVAPWQFYALWLVIGICLAGCLYEPCFAMVTRARGGNAKQGIIAITLVAGFAGTVSFPSVHFLSELLGLRAATAAMGVFVALIVAPLLWVGARQLGELGETKQREKSSGHAYLRKPEYWFLGIGFAFGAVVHGACLNHLLPILAERGVAAETAVFAAACVGPMQVVGRLMMVATQRRLNTHVFALIAFSFMGGSAALLLLADSNLALIAAFVLLFGSAYGTVSILRPVIARDLLGEENFGAKSGGLALMYLAASASSAYFGAVIWGLAGYNALLVILVGFAAMGACLYIIANRIARRTATGL